LKVAIFGIQGQLGRDLESALAGFEIIPMLYEQVDVMRADQVEAAVAAARPQWIINSAAMTHVDRCETEVSEAFAVNALGALHVARASASVGARLLFVSTDYVFDGEKGAPYVENDPPRPINVYGVTKLAGEWFVSQACSEHYIVRTSGLYGLHPCWGKGTNFVETMLRLAAERDELRVVADRGPHSDVHRGPGRPDTPYDGSGPALRRLSRHQRGPMLLVRVCRRDIPAVRGLGETLADCFFAVESSRKAAVELGAGERGVESRKPQRLSGMEGCSRPLSAQSRPATRAGVSGATGQTPSENQLQQQCEHDADDDHGQQ